MPRALKQKRNGSAAQSSSSSPYAKTKGANNIFKMNTDLGQHVLKNPGVAQAIVDKADLKQSDVSVPPLYIHFLAIHSLHCLSFYGGEGDGEGKGSGLSSSQRLDWSQIKATPERKKKKNIG